LSLSLSAASALSAVKNPCDKPRVTKEVKE
jgi:hypothetical protein